MPLVVLGAGGHGRDIAQVAQRAGWHVVGFLDDNIADRHIIGTFADLPTVGAVAVIGLNSSQDRARVDSGHPAPRFVADGSTSLAFDLRTLPGVVFGSNVAVGPGVVLGRHTHIGAGSTITRAVLGDYVTLAPGVDVAGDVMIGNRVQVGIGAKISNFVQIGDDAVIGAGAVVLEDVPAGATVVSKGVKGVVL